MRYKNIETGAVIDSPFVIKGKHWVLEGEEVKKRDLEKLTKSELYDMLEIQDIPYKPEQTKKELIDLLGGD